LSECTWHQTTWLDRRNQLLASASCAARDVESRVFEVYPPEYQAWARTTHRPVKPTAYSPNCPPDASALQASDSAPLRIIAPLDGEHFVLDPDRPRGLQRLAIQVVASSAAEPVTLLINDDTPAQLPANLQYDWQLSSGTHTFIAKTRNATSNAVQIHIR
jgi:Penicillin-Binding Protein C-terminus Family